MFSEPVSHNGFFLVQNNLRVIWQVDVAYLHELLADSQIIKVSPVAVSKLRPRFFGRTSRDTIAAGALHSDCTLSGASSARSTRATRSLSSQRTCNSRDLQSVYAFLCSYAPPNCCAVSCRCGPLSIMVSWLSSIFICKRYAPRAWMSLASVACLQSASRLLFRIYI